MINMDKAETEKLVKIEGLIIKAQDTSLKYREIKDDDQLKEANFLFRDFQIVINEINGLFDPHIAKAHEEHKSLLADKKKYTDRYLPIQQVVGKAIANYLAEQRRKREEAQAARDRIETDRIRQQQKAQAEATKAVDRGDEGKALNILAKSSIKDQILMEAKPIVPSKPATEGIQQRAIWKYEITNPDLLPREFLMPNLSAIGKHISFLKGDCIIPMAKFGVRVFSENILAVRQG